MRDEFSFVSDLMAAVECDSRDESGPGRSFSLGGRTILRAHPKRRHLALGFHDSLRADVEALTHALRDQRGAAWLNFKPGLCDRDTIEILCDKGLRAATLALRASRWRTDLRYRQLQAVGRVPRLCGTTMLISA